MGIEFASCDYDKLEIDASFTLRFAPGIVKAYRKRLQFIRSSTNERDVSAIKSWCFEKLRGDRQHQHSIRLNDQYRLILEIIPDGDARKIRVITIEDYH